MAPTSPGGDGGSFILIEYWLFPELYNETVITDVTEFRPLLSPVNADGTSSRSNAG
ncbi:MAG: hypothetical protein ACFB21_15720 [Opitutales bacterium]